VKTVVELEFLPILVAVIVAMLVSYSRTIVFIDASGENAPATASSVFWAFIVLIPSIVGLGVLYQCSKMNPGFLSTGGVKTSKHGHENVSRKATEMNGNGNENGLGLNGSSQGGADAENEEALLFPKDDISSNISDVETKVDLDSMYTNKELDSAALWAGNWHQICPTCRIVKPLRAKHDAFSNRCVENFDHHCPWVANAIGKQNRWHFLVFLMLQMWALVISISVAVYKLTKLNQGSRNAPFVVAFLVFDASLTISVLTLLSAQASSIAKNITTNEMANQFRYNYLAMDSRGNLFNPFDKGCHQNCLEVMYPTKKLAPVTLDMEMTQRLRDWVTDKHLTNGKVRGRRCCSANQGCSHNHGHGGGDLESGRHG